MSRLQLLEKLATELSWQDTINNNNPDPMVTDWQNYLTTTGAYHGPVDGVLNPEIEQAIKTLESKTGKVILNNGKIQMPTSSIIPPVDSKFINAWQQYLKQNNKEFTKETIQALEDELAKYVPEVKGKIWKTSPQDYEKALSLAKTIKTAGAPIDAVDMKEKPPTATAPGLTADQAVSQIRDAIPETTNQQGTTTNKMPGIFDPDTEHEEIIRQLKKKKNTKKKFSITNPV